jgi:hypothetical protein
MPVSVNPRWLKKLAASEAVLERSRKIFYVVVVIDDDIKMLETNSLGS